MNSLKPWLHGLGAAVIGAAATAGSAALADPQQFNFSQFFSHHGLIQFAKLLGIPALLAAFAYLKQSPLPENKDAAHCEARFNLHRSSL